MAEKSLQLCVFLFLVFFYIFPLLIFWKIKSVLISITISTPTVSTMLSLKRVTSAISAVNHGLLTLCKQCNTDSRCSLLTPCAIYETTKWFNSPKFTWWLRNKSAFYPASCFLVSWRTWWTAGLSDAVLPLRRSGKGHCINWPWLCAAKRSWAPAQCRCELCRGSRDLLL